jgi:hypothetical protein
MTKQEIYLPFTSYGQSEYDLEDLLPSFPGSKAYVRSKIRFGMNFDSYLPYILPARSLGLLPNLSTLWDIIPFSFLIDKALDVSSALGYIDDTAILLAMDIEYSTHSIGCIYNFTEEDQDKFRFTVEPSSYSYESTNLSGYKVYLRYSISGAIPTLGPTRISILRSPGITDWFTTGALAYKFS